MSLKIIKAGIFDTVQDGGRFGYQHLGIGPGGAMDLFSAQLGNALLGKPLNDAVIELHYPASVILFEKESIICLTGADFSPCLNEQPVALNQPIAVSAGTVLRFRKNVWGVRAYLSVLQALELFPWLNSYSTNIRARAGGLHGGRLVQDDRISFQHTPEISNYLSGAAYRPLGWRAAEIPPPTASIHFTIGNEWDLMSHESQTRFLNAAFRITPASDRMGYRCAGPPLSLSNDAQMISSAVSTGTVQLLPNGELIILMADRQTTGGYPRIVQVITAHLHHLAQLGPGSELRFVMTTIDEAEKRLVQQYRFLEQLQKTCLFKIRAGYAD